MTGEHSGTGDLLILAGGPGCHCAQRGGAADVRPDRSPLMAIPIAGWLFIGYGLLRPLRRPVLRVVFWIDVLLSVGVHAAQIPAARKVSRPLGFSLRYTVAMTMLFGATWWRALASCPMTGYGCSPAAAAPLPGSSLMYPDGSRRTDDAGCPCGDSGC